MEFVEIVGEIEMKEDEIYIVFTPAMLRFIMRDKNNAGYFKGDSK